MPFSAATLVISPATARLRPTTPDPKTGVAGLLGNEASGPAVSALTRIGGGLHSGTGADPLAEANRQRAEGNATLRSILEKLGGQSPAGAGAGGFYS